MPSTKRRTAGVYSRKRPLGPNGERICYNCGGPLAKGRRFNCSSECSEEWQGKTSPAYMRRLILKRDRGVCKKCGVDTLALKKELERTLSGIRNHDLYLQLRRDFAAAHKIPSSRLGGDLWDADHIVPVVEGGGECGLDNYQTLCIPCHAEETRELARRRARARHEARPLPLLDQAGI